MSNFNIVPRLDFIPIQSVPLVLIKSITYGNIDVEYSPTVASKFCLLLNYIAAYYEGHHWIFHHNIIQTRVLTNLETSLAFQINNSYIIIFI